MRPRSTQNSAPTGNAEQKVSHGSSCSHAERSIPDLATPATLAPADQNGPALTVKIGLGQRERFADPESGAPEHHDHAA